MYNKKSYTIFLSAKFYLGQFLKIISLFKVWKKQSVCNVDVSRQCCMYINDSGVFNSNMAHYVAAHEHNQIIL